MNFNFVNTAMKRGILMDDEETYDKTPEEFVLDIQESCSKLTWCIAINEKEEGVHGLIIGNAKYIQKIVSQLDDGDEYDVLISPSIAGELH